MGNALILLQLVTQWGGSIVAAGDVLRKAAAEGRDVTAEELAALSAQAQTAIDAAAKS